MRILAIAIVLLVGCVQQPTESSTEQATLSETQARIAATNAVIAYEAQQCTEQNLCAPAAPAIGEDSFGFIDCGGSQDGMMCCFWYFCCTVWYMGDLSCAWYGN